MDKAGAFNCSLVFVLTCRENLVVSIICQVLCRRTCFDSFYAGKRTNGTAIPRSMGGDVGRVVIFGSNLKSLDKFKENFPFFQISDRM